MSFLNLDNAPACEDQFEEWKEKEIEKRIQEIKNIFSVARKKADLDAIIKKFSIKVFKGGKIKSASYEKMDVKRKIIKFAIDEPEDIFDLDTYNEYLSKSQ